MLTAASSRLDLLGIDHVDFYVEDAVYWRAWFRDILDFQPIASLVSANGDTQVEILEHYDIQIRVSAPLESTSPVDRYLQKHPPGIANIAFAVPPTDLNINDEILVWGNLTHKFINHFSKLSLKDFSKYQQPAYQMFTHIDHLVLNVPSGEMWSAAKWYEQNLGLQAGDRFHIKTQHSALKSVVMSNKDSLPDDYYHKIQIPINEPSTANSQVQEFLDYNRGAGIQHLALHTDDIFTTVKILKQRGLKFLETSPSILRETQDPITGQTLLQIFTQPIFGLPTFFFEIIQRQNQAQGFGEGNFQALFEAIEREQIIRVNSI